jgi:predicted dehydrogenase
MNKRSFFKAWAALVVPSRIFGANDRIRLGFIGLGGRARFLISSEEYPGAEIVAVADCFLPRCYEAAKLREAGARWGKYQEYRRMFEKEKLDAVFVETTTHARVLVAIHALQAGLDVYAEKPLTLTVAEGCKLVREGAIGKIRSVIVCNFTGPARWTSKPVGAVVGLRWRRAVLGRVRLGNPRPGPSAVRPGHG